MAKQLNKETEQLIFDVSALMFQKKGYAATKLQDIAKEADINQSLLHYYFRNKENLFKTVLRHKVVQLFSELETLLIENTNNTKENELTFKKLILVYQQFFIKNPNFPMFVISELNNNPQIMKEIFSNDEIKVFKQKSLEKINEILRKIKSDIAAEHVLISLISIIIFPFMAKELLKLIFDKNDDDYNKFMNERTSLLWDMAKKLLI